VLLERLKVGVGEGLTGCKVAGGTEVVFGGLEVHARAGGHSVDRFERDGSYFGPDSIATDYSEVINTCHAVAPSRKIYSNFTPDGAGASGIAA
jgi:hypothetical protein